MIAVVDYGASNVPSVLGGLRAVQADAAVTADPATVRGAPRVVVPGVGTFAPAMRRLVAAGLADAVREVARSGRPVLGICLGLQLLLESSDEAPGVPGLGLLAGRVRRFATDLPVRSEEHTSELQSLAYLVCRLLLEKKKKNKTIAVESPTT